MQAHDGFKFADNGADTGSRLLVFKRGQLLFLVAGGQPMVSRLL
jgi:hypothetical protein